MLVLPWSQLISAHQGRWCLQVPMQVWRRPRPCFMNCVEVDVGEPEHPWLDTTRLHQPARQHRLPPNHRVFGHLLHEQRLPGRTKGRCSVAAFRSLEIKVENHKDSTGPRLSVIDEGAIPVAKSRAAGEGESGINSDTSTAVRPPKSAEQCRGVLEWVLRGEDEEGLPDLWEGPGAFPSGSWPWRLPRSTLLSTLCLVQHCRGAFHPLVEHFFGAALHTGSLGNGLCHSLQGEKPTLCSTVSRSQQREPCCMGFQPL